MNTKLNLIKISTYIVLLLFGFLLSIILLSKLINNNINIEEISLDKSIIVIESKTCPNCIEYNKYTLKNEKVQNFLKSNDIKLIQLDVKKDKNIINKLNLDFEYVPTTFVFVDNTNIDKFVGNYFDNKFLQQIEYLKNSK